MSAAPIGTGLTTVRVQVQPVEEGDLITWTFPAITGTAREQVEYEVVARLFPNKGLLHDTIKITYPFGVWNEPLDRDVPVIGTGPKCPDPRPEPPRPAPPFQPQFQPPAPNGHGMGPLPDPRQQKARGDDAQAHLAQFLAGWAGQHQLSSAEYYLYLSRALMSHAAQLTALEARPRRV